MYNFYDILSKCMPLITFLFLSGFVIVTLPQSMQNYVWLISRILVVLYGIFVIIYFSYNNLFKLNFLFTIKNRNLVVKNKLEKTTKIGLDNHDFLFQIIPSSTFFGTVSSRACRLIILDQNGYSKTYECTAFRKYVFKQFEKELIEVKESDI